MNLFKNSVKILTKHELFAVCALTVFLLTVFFHQVLLGRYPIPSDIITGMYYPWLDYKWGLTTQVPVKNSLLADAVSVTYPFKMLGVEMIKNGEIPLWNRHAFGGYPLLASSTVGILFPTVIFFLILPFNIALSFQIIFQPLIAFLSMYILARHFKLSKLASVFSAVAYGFGGFTMLWLEWNSHATTIAFLPLLIYFEDNLLENKNYGKWGMGLAVTFAIQIFSGYIPVVGFSLIAMTVYLCFKKRIIRRLLLLAKYLLLGLLLSSIYLLPYIELILNSQRTLETLPVNEALVSLWSAIGIAIPDYFGNPVTANHWGNGYYLNMAVYTGIVCLMLAIVGFIGNCSRKNIKFAGLLIIIVFIAMYNSPISRLIFNLGIWGGTSNSLNRFAFVVNFALAILAGYGMDSLKDNVKLAFKVMFLLVLLIIGTNLLFFLINKYHIPVSLEVGMTQIKVGVRNSVLPLAVLSTSFLAILVYKNYVRNTILLKMTLIALLIFELFRFGLKFNTFGKPEFLYPSTPVIDYLKQYPDDRFVSADKDILSANMWIPFGLSSLSGYDAAYPMKIAEYISVNNSGKENAIPQNKSGSIDVISNLLSIANTRFILTKKDSNFFKSVIDLNNENYKIVFDDKSIVILENLSSLPRAYFVSNVLKANNGKSLSYLVNNEFDFRNFAVTKEFSFSGENIDIESSTVKYETVSNNHTRINTNNKADSYLVITDTYYPGWEAEIDKLPVKIVRTNHAFMGIVVPSGNHRIDIVYKPRSFYLGSLISLSAILYLIFGKLKYIFKIIFLNKI